MTQTHIARINDLLAHDDESRSSSTLRSLLLDAPNFDTSLNDLIDPEYDTTLEIATELRESLISLFTTINDPNAESRSEREYLTEIALSLSLCPIHLNDYAICFDDNDDECAQIRMIHPCCDT